MVDTAPAQLTSYDPSLGVLSLPFMFKTEKQGLAALDGPGGQMLNASLFNAGFKLLGWQLNGFRHLCTTKPVRKVSDLKGMRIRVIPSPVTQAVYSALGANPVGMNFSEVPTALTSGVIDGLDFPIVPAFGNQLWNYCKYYTLSATSFEVIATVMNRGAWEKLPAQYQTLVASAERNATLWQRIENTKVEVTGLAALKSHGMQVITLPATEQKLLRKLTYPVWTNWTKQYGSTVLNALLKGASH
jgi:TRAP-type C4-dicarboxylate transport system substrate-binding protein